MYLIYNIQLSYLIVIGLMAISLIKVLLVKGGGNKLKLKPFELPDTMPLRGIMACLIIVTHVSNKYGAEHFSRPFIYVGAPIVSTFFFMSGYGLTISFLRKGKEYLNGFFRKTIFKLLLPFLLACIIWIFIAFICLDKNLITLLKGLVLFNPPLPYSWFVYALLVLYCAFYSVYSNISRKWLRQITLLLVTVAFSVALRMLNYGEWWYISLFAFNIGVAYGEINKWANMILQRYPISVISTYILLIAVLDIFDVTGVSLSIIPVGVVVPILILGSLKRYGWLSYLGKISYEIYLVHGIVVSLLGYIAMSWVEYLLLAESISILSAAILKTTIDKSFLKLSKSQL